jgi:hypothetical protein
MLRAGDTFLVRPESTQDPAAPSVQTQDSGWYFSLIRYLL